MIKKLIKKQINFMQEHFKDVTGDLYRTKASIHRNVLICDY